MIHTIKKWLGIGPPVNYADLVKQGAIILDVRSKGEFESGNITGSINISVDSLAQNLNKLNKQKTIITCCASGMRSAAAKGILKSNGFTTVYNGGGWYSLQNKLKVK